MPEEKAYSGFADPALFRLLVDRVKDYAIFALDPCGHVVTWNAGAELLKGYRAEDIIGQHIERFYTEGDRRDGKPARLLQTALTKGAVEDLGWRVRQDGSRFWADVLITVLYDETGVHRGYAKVTRDLTERKLMEDKLQRSYQELERRVAERTKDLAALNEQLNEKNQELEQFADVVVGRELKMLELEQEVQRLRDENAHLRGQT